MKNIDTGGHVTGRSVYVDDIPELTGTLHAVPVLSEKAHALISKMDLTQAEKAKGIIGILAAKDIPGENQIGGILPDEPLFATDEVHYIGQPVAVIIATDHFAARDARKLVKIDYEELDVITDPRVAQQKGQLLFPPRTFANGDMDKGFTDCDYIFEGRADSGGQEHIYIETQGSYAVPQENNNLKVFSSTQGPTVVQKTIARVLGLPMHCIEVDVTRLGGAFGGKEDQATAWAVMAALAAKKFHKPVKLILDRDDDIVATGKRHPYSSDFRIGLDKDLKIKAFEVTLYQNGGAAADLSPAIMERTLFHVTNAYYIPNVKATAYSCKTNLAPFTAFRGFGGPQGMYVIEAAIAHAATRLGVDKSEIQQQNLIDKGDQFHYGQVCDSHNARKSWEELHHHFNVEKARSAVNDFNKTHRFVKKGLSIMPICFGISFTKTPMNNARALVHVYQDGSVGVSTGAVEMGQGVNTKLMQVAARVFSVNISRIKLETTNTTRVANTSPTAASSGADLNGKALQIACNEILQRLKKEAAELLKIEIVHISIRNEKVYIDDQPTELAWEALVEKAFLSRIKLSEVGHYATPVIHFDKTKEKGHPFTYHVYGAALITVTLDCIKGIYETDSVQIVHDFGNSLNLTIDKGQVEGAVVQGIGWMTLEELTYDQNGHLLADSLSKYKIPDVYSAPKVIETIPLVTNGPELAIMKSKAVGEPPFMYGIGVYFALRNAVREFNPETPLGYNAPLTPEKVLLALYDKKG